MQVEEIRDKVRGVVHMHAEAEKSIVDYDVTRADDLCNETFDVVREAGGHEDDEHDEVVAEHAVKRNAIATELQNLNR